MPYLQLPPEETLGDIGGDHNCGCSNNSRQGSISFLGQPSAPAQTAAPVFRFECPAGCAPVSAGQCRNILRRAIHDAIFLAANATSKLEANPRDPSTVRKFRFFFGHDPSRPVPWAGNMESGASVAHRFRKVAEALQGRGTLYRCGCPGAGPEVRARTNARVEPNAVNLCARFWNPPPGLRLSHRFFRAGVILHEMLHLLYHEFFHHPGHPSGDPVRRRDNAHCYETFALRVAGRAADPSDVTACRDQLAGNLGIWGLENDSIPTRPLHRKVLTLNPLDLEKSLLTPELMKTLRNFANHVRYSWSVKSTEPIGSIFLKGHTDNTGKQGFNVTLGNQRAQVVKEALENLLKDLRLKHPIKILVDASPGELEPTADNRTRQGRALNRRVEVFIAPYVQNPPEPVIKTTPGPYPWGQEPTLPPGKSVKQTADEWLKDRGVPKWIRNKIWDAFVGGDRSLVGVLLEQAGIRGEPKDAFMAILSAGSQSKIR
jgi:hypothetical protein